MKTFKDFVCEEELCAEELGFGQEERSTFLHYLLLRLLYKASMMEDDLIDICSMLEVSDSRPNVEAKEAE